VIVAVTRYALSDAGFAKVEIAIVAGRAMIMSIRNVLLTAVAADGETGGSYWTNGRGCHLLRSRGEGLTAGHLGSEAGEFIA